MYIDVFFTISPGVHRSIFCNWWPSTSQQLSSLFAHSNLLRRFRPSLKHPVRSALVNVCSGSCVMLTLKRITDFTMSCSRPRSCKLSTRSCLPISINQSVNPFVSEIHYEASASFSYASITFLFVLCHLIVYLVRAAHCKLGHRRRLGRGCQCSSSSPFPVLRGH